MKNEKDLIRVDMPNKTLYFTEQELHTIITSHPATWGIAMGRGEEQGEQKNKMGELK